MSVRTHLLALALFLTSPAGWAETRQAQSADLTVATIPAKSGDIAQLWNQLLRGIGIGTPPVRTSVDDFAAETPGSPGAALAQRRAELAAIAEQNRLHQAEMEALSEIVRERDAELARRTAEQAELAERLTQLEAVMNGTD